MRTALSSDYILQCATPFLYFGGDPKQIDGRKMVATSIPIKYSVEINIRLAISWSKRVNHLNLHVAK